MNDERVREILRELGEEPVPGDSLARVRARVDERIAARRARRWWMAPVAAVAVAVVLVVWLWRPAPPAAPAVTAVARTPISLPVPAATEQAPAPAKPPQRRASPRRPARILSGPAIRVETADPDVVLIFVTEGGGE